MEDIIDNLKRSKILSMKTIGTGRIPLVSKSIITKTRIADTRALVMYYNVMITKGKSCILLEILGKEMLRRSLKKTKNLTTTGMKKSHILI